ncbi:MAG: hypothetical protein AAB490_01540 [Patescibacteria group bacterium]
MKEKKGGKEYLVRQIARSRNGNPAARELVRSHPAIEVIESGGVSEAAIVRMTESTVERVRRRNTHLAIVEHR